MGPLTNGLNSWLINGGYFTNYLHPLGAHPPSRENPGRFAKFDGALRGSSLTNGGPQNGGLEKVTGPFRHGNCWYLC